MVAVRGQLLRVNVRHGDRGLPLLLLNGIGSSLELLDPFVRALGGGRTVVRFDVPGVGGSPLPRIGYHMTTLPFLVAGLLNRLGYRQVDLLGISWGGGLAQQFTAQYRSRVRRLVLVATGTGSVMVPGHPRVLAKMITPRRHRDPGYAVRIAGDIYGGSFRTDPQQAYDVLHANSRAGPRRGYAHQLLAGLGWSSLPLLPMIRQPTLVLVGDDDPIVPAVNGHIMARLLPRGTLEVYRGGHLALVTDAHCLAPRIERFLDVHRSYRNGEENP